MRTGSRTDFGFCMQAPCKRHAVRGCVRVRDVVVRTAFVPSSCTVGEALVVGV